MRTLNLTTVGSFSVLVALIGIVTGNVKGGGKRSICITCVIAALCFGAAIVLASEEFSHIQSGDNRQSRSADLGQCAGN